MYFLSCVTIIMILEHFDHPTKKTLLPTKKNVRNGPKGFPGGPVAKSLCSR